jgi:hypothetical protein
MRRMRFACWIITATDTHSEYVMFNVFPQTLLLSERAFLLRYTYFACLFVISLRIAEECMFLLSISEKFYA